MILIAESGSTKTRWYLVDDLSIRETVTKGLNPNSISEKEFKEVIRRSILPNMKPARVFFYGAGCGSKANQQKVKKNIQSIFPKIKIEVNTDLLAAAKGLLGTRKGIVCILGTGSNAGKYDGKKITSTPPSLGYILGDEGSGSWIGKSLIQSYYNREMPAPLRLKIKGQRPKDLTDLNKLLYQGNAPAAFLGSFAPFASKNKKHPFIKKLLQTGFTLYRDRFLMKLKPTKNSAIVFTGSIAWEFKEILAPIIQEKVKADIRFWKEPGDGLVLYHWAQSKSLK